MNQLKSFCTGVQFLTRLPCPSFNFKNEYFIQAMLYFPVVGLLVGLIIAGIHYLLSPIFGQQAGSAIIIFIYVMITGGLHLDGLMDTIDGIFSHRAKEKVLEIMKDSRVGAHGVTGAIVILLLKYSFYQQLGLLVSYTVFLQIFILSRWSMVALIHCFPYIRAEGLGKMYKEQSTAKQFWGASVLTILMLLGLGWQQGLILLTLLCIITWLYGRKITQCLGGLTGDTYGAYAELAEVCGFFFVFLIPN